MDAVRVLLVGAQRASLEALATSLDGIGGITAVGIITHTPDVATELRKSRAGVLLAEGALLAEDPSCEFIRGALDASPNLRVVVLGGSEDLALWALCEGAVGFVSDEAGLAGVVSAVKEVAEHGVSLPAKTQRALLIRYQEVGPGWSLGRDALTGLLTGRELEIVRLIADGGTNASVASRCGISESTVKNHLANIFRKLGAYSRSHMVSQAFRRGLLDRGV